MTNRIRLREIHFMRGVATLSLLLFSLVSMMLFGLPIVEASIPNSTPGTGDEAVFDGTFTDW